MLLFSGIELCLALILTQIPLVGYRCLLLVIISYRCLLLVIISYRQLPEKGRFLYGMVAASRFRQDYGKNSRDFQESKGWLRYDLKMKPP